MHWGKVNEVFWQAQGEYGPSITRSPKDKCVKRDIGVLDSPPGAGEISGGTFQP